MEASPLAPTAGEVMLAVGAVVAVVFIAYAVWRMATRAWPVPFGLTLIVLTWIIPFSGPLLLVLARMWVRLEARRTTSIA